MSRRTYTDSPTEPTTTLDATLSNGATTITLASDPGSEMPTTGPFSCVVGSGASAKAVNCASRAGTTITLVSAWAGGTFASGSPINTAPTKLDADKWIQSGEAEIVDADVSASAGIAATKIGSGNVDNTEYGYLAGVTSPIQTQIDAKYGSGSTILAANGSASAPGHGFSGDSDTGTYRLGANILGIAAGTVEAARFSSNATVGITMQLPVKFVGEIRYDYDTLFLDSATSYTRTTSSKPFQFVYNFDSADATYYFNAPSGSVAQIITLDPYASAGLYIPALSLTMAPGDTVWALYDPASAAWIKLN